MDVKGTAILVVPAFIRDRFREAGLASWLAALSPEAQAVYREAISVSRWYPLRSVLTEPTLKLCELFYGGDSSGARELGRFSADYALKGIYRAFVRLGSTEFIVKEGATVLPTYYRGAVIEISHKEKRRVIMRIRKFEDLHPVIEQRIAGWICRALEISGGRDVKAEIAASLTRNDPSTDFVVTWEP